MSRTSSAYRLLLTVDEDSKTVEHPAKQKLQSFRKLPVGWDSGKGGPIPGPIVESADAVLDIGMALGFRADVFPGSGDNVAVTFYSGDECLEAIVDETDSIEIFKEKGRGFSTTLVDHLEVSDLLAFHEVLVDWGKLSPWSSRESSIPGTLTFHDEASPTLLSSPPRGTTARILRTASAGSL